MVTMMNMIIMMTMIISKWHWALIGEMSNSHGSSVCNAWLSISSLWGAGRVYDQATLDNNCPTQSALFPPVNNLSHASAPFFQVRAIASSRLAAAEASCAERWRTEPYKTGGHPDACLSWQCYRQNLRPGSSSTSLAGNSQNKAPKTNEASACTSRAKGSQHGRLMRHTARQTALMRTSRFHKVQRSQHAVLRSTCGGDGRRSSPPPPLGWCQIMPVSIARRTGPALYIELRCIAALAPYRAAVSSCLSDSAICHRHDAQCRTVEFWSIGLKFSLCDFARRICLLAT